MSNYRASKSGIAADIEKKLEQKLDDLEDEGVPLAIVDWLNAVLDSEADVCEGTEWQDIQEFLKDGTRLCRVMNALRESEGETPIKFANSQSAFFCMDNIGKFLRAAELYGVKKNDLFQTSDLYEGVKGPFVNVLTSLHALGLVSKSRYYLPEYCGRGALAQENRRGFSEEEVKAQSAGMLPKINSASHGLASQAGMRAPGTGRHIVDQ